MNADKLCAGKTADVMAVWQTLRQEAAKVAAEESSLVHLVDDVILSRDSAAAAGISRILADRRGAPRRVVAQRFREPHDHAE